MTAPKQRHRAHARSPLTGRSTWTLCGLPDRPDQITEIATRVDCETCVKLLAGGPVHGMSPKVVAALRP